MASLVATKDYDYDKSAVGQFPTQRAQGSLTGVDISLILDIIWFVGRVVATIHQRLAYCEIVMK